MALLVFLLQDILKMVTKVTETCRCKKKTIYIYISEQLHKCAFVGLCMNIKLILMHVMEHTKLSELQEYSYFYFYIISYCM